jgi:hypothetical protein
MLTNDMEMTRAQRINTSRRSKQFPANNFRFKHKNQSAACSDGFPVMFGGMALLPWLLVVNVWLFWRDFRDPYGNKEIKRSE